MYQGDQGKMKSIVIQEEISERKRKYQIHKTADTLLKLANQISCPRSWRQYFTYIWNHHEKGEYKLVYLNVTTRMPTSMSNKKMKCFPQFSKFVVRTGSYEVSPISAYFHPSPRLTFMEEGSKISPKPFVMVHSV